MRLDKLYDEIEEIETFIEAVGTRLYNIKQEKIPGDTRTTARDGTRCKNWFVRRKT